MSGKPSAKSGPIALTQADVDAMPRGGPLAHAVRKRLQQRKPLRKKAKRAGAAKARPEPVGRAELTQLRLQRRKGRIEKRFSAGEPRSPAKAVESRHQKRAPTQTPPTAR